MGALVVTYTSLGVPLKGSFYLYYFGGSLLVYWAPKPYSNY